MAMYPEKKCPRCRNDCLPLGQVLAEDESTFVCAGERLGDPATWAVPQDVFTFCWKSQDGVDTMQWMDRYDMHSHIYALSRALLMDDIKPVPAERVVGEIVNPHVLPHVPEPLPFWLTCTCGWSSGQCREDCPRVREFRAKSTGDER
jgi:hypothetical protein